MWFYKLYQADRCLKCAFRWVTMAAFQTLVYTPTVILVPNLLQLPIPVAERSNEWVCGRSLAGIVRSNPVGGMDVSLMSVVYCQVRGLCVEPIIRPEESYWLWCVVVCDLETTRRWKPWPALGHRKKIFRFTQRLWHSIIPEGSGKLKEVTGHCLLVQESQRFSNSVAWS